MTILEIPPERRGDLIRLWRELRELEPSSPEDAAALAHRLDVEIRRLMDTTYEPYPWQHPHVHPDGWVSERAPGVCDDRCLKLPVAPIPTLGTFLALGGRGTGKTEGAARYIDAHMQGPPCDTRLPGGHRIAIIAPTQGDAVQACVRGPSGLKTINPDVVMSGGPGGLEVRWPNSAVARLLGAYTPEDGERLRASGNVCACWLEELAAMRRLDDVLTQTAMGLRLGSNPHYVASTTPKPRPEIVKLLAAPSTVHTKGRTRDATKIDPAWRAKLFADFNGTRAGRQELDAEILPDVEGSLWITERPKHQDHLPEADREMRPGLEDTRVGVDTVGWISHREEAPAPADGLLVMERTIVAVDPPGGRTEAGIVVVGQAGMHAYVLADLSVAAGPDVWATRAIDAYYDYGCVGVATERAYGGDMVDDVILVRDPGIPLFRVPTKVGKRLRAEPVVAMYEQGRVHHVGVLPVLEAEQTSWVPGESKDSPNRVDALVHAVTWLLIRARAASVSSASPSGRRVPSQWSR